MLGACTLTYWGKLVTSVSGGGSAWRLTYRALIGVRTSIPLAGALVKDAIEVHPWATKVDGTRKK
jgi:hypothetical protein